MVFDTNVFRNIKSPEDFAREEQEFEMRKRQRAMQEQMGNMRMQQAQQQMAADAQRRAAMRQLSQGLGQGQDIETLLQQQAVATGDPSAYLDYKTKAALASRTQSDPASVREYQYFSALSPEEQKQYLGMKRAQQTLNLGGTQAVLDPMGGIQQQYTVTPKMSELPEFKGMQAGAAEQARLQQQLAIEPQIDVARKQAKFEQEKREQLGAKGRQVTAMGQREQMIQDKMESIRERVGATTTGLGGAILGLVPGSPAYDLSADVETLLANAGFDRLQEMRDNSPTGGALGQVSERELSLLQAAAQNLQTSQSEEQFLRNLDAFEQQRKQAFQNVRAAYEQDLQTYGAESMPNFGFSAKQRYTATPSNISNIPMGAIRMLKENPDLEPQFDEKYGEGAARQVLGAM